MAIRLSGLNSGLDTEAIVSAMVSAYSTKKDKYVKAQTKLEWKQDAYKSINAKVYGLYKDINALRFTSAYNLKKTTVSDSTKASVSASGSAINGSQELGVAKLAKAGYLTGGQFKSGTTGSTKLSELTGFTGDGTISVNGKDVNVTGDTTIDQFVTKLNDAGVKASFDATNRRIFVSAKDSGVENDFTLMGADSNGNSALLALGLYQGVKEESATYIEAQKLAKYSGKSDDVLKTILNGLKSAHESLDEATAAKKSNQAALDYAKAYDLVNGYVDSADSVVSEAAGKLNALLDAGAEEAAYYDPYSDTFYKHVKENDDGNGNKTYTYYNEEDENGEPTDAITRADSLMSYEDRRKELAAKAGLLTKETDDEGKVTYKDNGYAKYVAARATIKEYEASDSETAETIKANVSQAITDYTVAIKANVEDIASANKTISDGVDLDKYLDEYDPESDTGLDSIKARIAAAKDIVDDAKLSESELKEKLKDTASATATRVDGQDAVIYLNGAKFTGSSNKFTINGLTINATGVTGTEEEIKAGTGNVTITTATDTDGIYDKVKDFLSKYNEVVNSLSSLYNADSAKGYEPLTDDEKEQLTDTQVEKWEQKIKDSLLRRDQTIGNIMSVMSNAMAKSYEIGGKKVSLSTFGINTLGYFNSDVNEKYAYHIDGDEDDSATSTNKDKLKAAIEEDPETVTDFLKQLTDGLYKSLDKQMKSTSMRSAYTIYNDKEMEKEKANYTKLISTWEDRISAMEESYFKKFTAMEKALSTMQSNSSALGGLLGG